MGPLVKKPGVYGAVLVSGVLQRWCLWKYLFHFGRAWGRQVRGRLSWLFPKGNRRPLLRYWDEEMKARVLNTLCFLSSYIKDV